MSSLFNHKNPRRVLFIAPEAKPFAKAGGLGEVIFSLPRALEKLGHDVRLMIPRYAGIDLEKFHLRMEYEGLEVPTDCKSGKENEPTHLICNVRKYVPGVAKNGSAAHNSSDELPVTTYFLENEEYYEKRSNVYGYSDDTIRWALLCRGALEFLKNSNDWIPDIIVASDWQTGFLPNYLKTNYKQYPKLSGISTVFIIHNLYYQGMFDHRFVSEMDFDDGQSAMPSFFDPRLFKINGMRRGIMYSDTITTVSPTYSQEIMTKDYGELLEDLLKERRARVYGVLNGIDYKDFNPETDENIISKYSVKAIGKRAKNKKELQSRFGLPCEKDTPIIGIASRFVEAKGFDLLFSIIEPLIRELKFQLVILGVGEAKYMGFFKELAERLPKNVSAHLSFDPILPRLIFSGSDMTLVPSKFEPCGLVQMEAMRYGSVPIVRKTGGLADSVVDFNPRTEEGTGFVFEDFNPLSLAIAITRACEHYRNQPVWKKLQKQAMSANFSWENSAAEYARLFEMIFNTNGKSNGKAGKSNH
ncbi:MAG: glycogen/starch synthase [Patescibacteria group bacterium]